MMRCKHTDTVELAGEDLEDNKSKAELSKRCANVGALKGTLCGTNLDQLRGCQDHRAGTVETESVAVLSMVCLHVYMSDLWHALV